MKLAHSLARALARALGLALALALPGSLAAQPTTTPLIYCVPGSSRACFAFAFASSGESTTFWLQNLQGSYGDDPTPFVINAILIDRRSETQQFLWTFARPVPFIHPEGDVHVVLPGLVFWDDSYADSGAHQQRAYYSPDLTYGLVGCDSPRLNPLTFDWRTCVRRGEDGWMRIDFRAFMDGDADLGDGTFVREIELADVNVTIIDIFHTRCTIVGANSGLEASAPSVPCISAPYDLQIAPEPVTAVLLGGGLACLGGIGLVRRRRRDRAA